MSKKTRDVMTPGPAEAAEFHPGHPIAADDYVDDALRAMVERHADRLAVTDGGQIVGSVTSGELAISIEDARTWSALCK
jgi:CBS domain-containing protein